MNDEKTGGIHGSFWVISVIALLWNLGGAMNFFVQLDGNAVESFPETHRAIINDRPLWATVGFAMSVFCGIVGSFMLLFKKSAAYYVFMGSLIGTVLTMIHTIRIANYTIDFKPVEILVMIVMPLIVAIFLVWYAKQAACKGWIS